MAKEKIGVVGAGLMGAEIALVFALAGHEVVLSDTGEPALAAALERLARVLDRGIQRGFYTDDEKPLALARLSTTVALGPLADCDFVTEAVFEDEAVKAETYRRLDALCRPGCIFASNTSTIPISTLASYVGEARRPYFIGTHYFSPASRMKLVEIIPAFDTAPETVETALRLCREADKTPIRIKDVAGFAVNRMFLIFLNEAVRLVEEGVATPEDIDTACKLGLGHPMGPFELMDATTSKLCLQVSEILHAAYGERFRPPALLQQRVKAGFVGGRNARLAQVRLAGKIAVVTGAAQGIGAALCERFAGEGARTVVAADIDAAGADAVARRIGGVAVACDVGREDAIARLIGDTEARLGPIDLFCSNAGIAVLDPDWDDPASAPTEDWMRSWAVNVMAHVYAARHLTARMAARGSGYFLNTVSAAGLLSQIGSGVYSATKHAALGFAENLAIATRDRGIRVSVLCPQGVDTAMLRGIDRGVPDRDGVLTADAVADAVVAGLASERFLILPHPEVATYLRRKVDDYDRWLGGMARLRRSL